MEPADIPTEVKEAQDQPSKTGDELLEQMKAQEEQQRDIARSVEEAELIGAPEPPSALKKLYEGNPKPGFLRGIDDLSKRYSSLRRVRGDGNCFYRAFLFSWCEVIIEGLSSEAESDRSAAEAELKRLTAAVVDSKAKLVALGYNEMVVDGFWEPFVEELQALPSKTLSLLETEFREEGGTAEYMVWYCRLLTSGFLKQHAERFLPFIEATGCPDVATFCAREVEPNGKECEQVQMMALCEALSVRVGVEYLDGQDFGERLMLITLPEEVRGEEAAFTLLYRPGHYDCLKK